MVSIPPCHGGDPGSIPGDREIHRSLMVRIAGFHPADPGSIPGDEDGLGRTLKSNQPTLLIRVLRITSAKRSCIHKLNAVGR